MGCQDVSHSRSQGTGEFSQAGKGFLLASVCNNHCRFCNLERDGEGARVVRDDESLEDRLRRRFGDGDRALTFVGAEPTLSDELPGAISRARQVGFERVGVQTNGRRLAYRRYTAGLVEAGLTDVEISLQGPNGAVHDYHTDVPNSFAQTLAGIIAAKDIELRVGVSTLMTRSNFRHIEGVVLLLNKLKVRHWQVGVVREEGAARDNRDSLVANLAMAAPALNRAVGAALSMGLIVSLRDLSMKLFEPAIVDRLLSSEAGEILFCPER